jgi:Zinc finger, C2H2 type/Zinc-finger of C2H2 type
MKVLHDIFRFECDECDEKFLSALELKEHKDEFHPAESGVPEFECGICRRKFNCHKTLEQHGHLHEKKSKKLAARRSGTTKYKKSYYEARCETCGIDGFESADDRRKHHAAHNGTYACKQCDKVFGFDSSYHTHFMNVHQGIKFECDLCQTHFTLASSLKRHKLTVHTNIFRFKCSFCEKPFKQKTQMETHVRSVNL